MLAFWVLRSANGCSRCKTNCIVPYMEVVPQKDFAVLIARRSSSAYELFLGNHHHCGIVKKVLGMFGTNEA